MTPKLYQAIPSVDDTVVLPLRDGSTIDAKLSRRELNAGVWTLYFVARHRDGKHWMIVRCFSDDGEFKPRDIVFAT